LNQLQSQISSHRETRDKLVQELADLKQQKRQLEAESSALRKDVDDLKRSRKELDQYLSETEKRKKDFDKGSHPLQTASKQLQAQVSTLQDELRRLEIQVSDRRKQKDDLERQLASLNIQHQALKERPVYSKSSSSEKNGGSSHHAANNGASNGNPAKELNPRPVASVATSPAVQPATQASPAPAVAKPEKPSSELSDEWNEFMGHLPEYEFLVLRAIVEQNNPAALLKKIAEDNLTMPEMLIDSINERALETVGDIIIEPGTGSGSATIAREHLRTVKRLLKTHGGE
jgi:myosin heavy subunit